MGEGEVMGVQELALETVAHLAPVGGIAAERVADGGEVGPDLVRAPRLQASLEVGLLGQQLEDGEMGSCFARGRAGDGHPVALPGGAADRGVDRPGPRAEAPARQRHRMAVSGAASRQARTHFEVLELLPRESYLEARLETGRTHQIRAHFAAIGHPLTGDTTYGGSERYGLRRQFLHAHRLAFVHPRSGEQLNFTSPLPDDLLTALEAAHAA